MSHVSGLFLVCSVFVLFCFGATSSCALGLLLAPLRNHSWQAGLKGLVRNEAHQQKNQDQKALYIFGSLKKRSEGTSAVGMGGVSNK